ncbi:MAG: zinc-ribbon domain-containing protein [Lachnospiraceae bacterium]|nr:zinc-ribbon domain-containing protein [Lachnospiraceae bacterium]
MKFCAKCGNSMEDNVKFCPACGEAQEMGDPVAAVAEGLKKNKKKIITIALIAVAAILVIVLLAKLFTPGYKKAAKKFMNAVEDLDLQEMYDLMPDFMVDMDKDEIRDKQNDMEDEMGDYKISYTITQTEKMDEERIESLEEDFDWMYDESVNIKKGYEVYVKMTVKEDGKKDTDTVVLYSLKIGSKWYVYPLGLGFMY